MTFDVEDFINDSSMAALHTILDRMEKMKLKGLFFVTGHMAEKLSSFRDVLALLSKQDVGYHSTSHSVRPTIFEYTDTQDYEKAVQSSLQRETSHIDPLTGRMQGTGGIIRLKALFPDKRIVAYRAPGFCWSPPHLEALHKLGIQFDFSADISRNPQHYKGITFYPFPYLLVPPEGSELDFLAYRGLAREILTKAVAVIDIHPQSLTSLTSWDSQFWRGNPAELTESLGKSMTESRDTVRKTEKLFRRLAILQKAALVAVTPPLRKADRILVPTIQTVEKSYRRSVWWPSQCFNYHPQHLHRLYLRFFGFSGNTNGAQ